MPLPTEIRTQKTPVPLRTLLTRVIDYAGLFPPAALSLQSAVRNYAVYLAGEHSSMLGRFIIPAPRLPELSEALRVQGLGSEWKVSDWKVKWTISALLGENYESEIASIVRFNSENHGRAFVDTIETKAQLPGRIEEVVAAAPAGIQLFAEIPLQTSAATLRGLQSSGARAKIRTGGLVPGAIPSTLDLAVFIVNAAKAEIAFKATAGLHHPLRCFKPLTYESNAPSAEMHGFINLLLASALALSGAGPDLLSEILADQNLSSFQLSDTALCWKKQSLSNFQLQSAREQMLLSFGSCSFEEPVHELSAMGWL
jgi:hypothetical protein